MEDYSGDFTPSPEDPQGILGLPATCDLADVEPALRRWVSSLNGSDSLKLAALREQACQELKARGVTAPAKLVDAALESRPRAKAATEQRADDAGAARAAGREMLEHPRPLELLEDSLREMGLGGSLVIPKTVFLAATTRLLSATLNQQAHLHVQGPASSGKSFEALAALEHLPERTVIRFDGASPRALIYYEGEIQHCVLLYSEMDGLPVGGDDGDAANVALTYLRTLCSEGRARYAVVEKNKDGGHSTVVYTREGPAVVVVTGTKPIPDEQLRSRVHEVEVRVDRERLGSVLHAQSSSLAGTVRAKVNPAIVAAQEYLQTLAPVDVHVPFAPELARLLFDRVKLADPRLSRELSRVAGFTAAHALLCIERRRRGPGGAVLAELEDYAAAREVVRELSTTREYTNTAIEVWEAVDLIYKQTSLPVTVAEVKKKLLKARSGISTAFGALLAGGALVDRREKPGRTVPHLVVPGTEHPDQVPLPKVEELSSLLHPPESSDKLDQVHTAQEANLSRQAEHLSRQVSSMTGNDLTPLVRPDGGGEGGDAPDERPNGSVYHVGDILPDGREVLKVDEAGRLLMVKRAPDPGVRL